MALDPDLKKHLGHPKTALGFINAKAKGRATQTTVGGSSLHARPLLRVHAALPVPCTTYAQGRCASSMYYCENGSTEHAGPGPFPQGNRLILKLAASLLNFSEKRCEDQHQTSEPYLC